MDEQKLPVPYGTLSSLGTSVHRSVPQSVTSHFLIATKQLYESLSVQSISMSVGYQLSYRVTRSDLCRVYGLVLDGEGQIKTALDGFPPHRNSLKDS